MMDELMLAGQPAAPVRVRANGARPRTRLGRRVFGTRAKRLVFLDALARSGDPAVAARGLGISVFDAYRVRDADAEFAAQWQDAITIAWERVENRLLSELLSEADAGEGKTSNLRDSKLALAILARRDAGTTRAGGSAGRPVDGAHVARLRAELRALADPG
ncbi:MAG: hypothetical protein KGQ52_02880 [Alphaproteobacteria bacterium]|nr:hypothetical protein [Alphaproteobacteria bacterium]